MERPHQAAASTYLMIVERGDDERYELLRKLFQSRRVDVVRDRRTGDRRGKGGGGGQPEPSAAANRRASERRAQMPESWVNLGFFVAKRRPK